jgi:hypothetical protein
MRSVGSAVKISLNSNWMYIQLLDCMLHFYIDYSS